MALRQPFIHKLAPLVVLLAILSGTLISCRTTSGLSLEEAQQISGAGEQGLTAPPRAGVTDIINTRYLEAFADETCKNEPPESVDLDQVIARIKNDCKIGGHSWGAQVCLSDKLFEAGRRAMNRGQYREAIDLIQTAIKSQKVGRGGAERYRGLLAASYAAIGDFSAARWNMGGGNSRGYMSQSGKYQVKVNYQVGKAALEKARATTGPRKSTIVRPRSIVMKRPWSSGHPACSYTRRPASCPTLVKCSSCGAGQWRPSLSCGRHCAALITEI